MSKDEALRELRRLYGPPRAQSVPLVTGTLTHEPLAAILKVVQATDTLPEVDLIRQEVARAKAAYLETVKVRGLAQVVAEADPCERDG